METASHTLWADVVSWNQFLVCVECLRSICNHKVSFTAFLYRMLLLSQEINHSVSFFPPILNVLNDYLIFLNNFLFLAFPFSLAVSRTNNLEEVNILNLHESFWRSSSTQYCFVGSSMRDGEGWAEAITPNQRVTFLMDLSGIFGYLVDKKIFTMNP